MAQGLADADFPADIGHNTEMIARATSHQLMAQNSGKTATTEVVLDDAIPGRLPLTYTPPGTPPEFSHAGGNAAKCQMNITVDEFKKMLNDRIDVTEKLKQQSRGPELVHNTAFEIESQFPGFRTISQIDAIYRYLKYGTANMGGWRYVGEPTCLTYFNYANQSIMLGNNPIMLDNKSIPQKSVGVGNCADFAILMAAFLESIGDTTRIVLANNNTTGVHAYAEVYIGNLNSSDNQVIDIIDWLKKNCNAEDVFVHINPDTEDVWLNLDWGLDEKGNAHPGGPFYQGDRQIAFFIGDNHVKMPITVNQQQTPTPDNITILQSAAIQTDITVNETESNTESKWYNIGNALSDQRRYDKAAYAYNNATTLNSSDSRVWINLGNALFRQAKLDTALQAYNNAIMLDNKSSFAWAMRGYILIHPPINNTTSEEALISLDQATRLDPNTAWYWNEKGNAFDYLNRSNEALIAKRKSIDLDPNSLYTWYDTALVYIHLHRYNDALNATNQAIQLGPNDADSWYVKYYCLKVLDRTIEANTALAKAKELGYTG